MLSRKVHGPRSVVLAWDPAVDESKSNLSAYLESGWDFDSGHLVLKQGEVATVWRVAPLTEAQKRRAKTYQVDSQDWADFVFRCCCHGVSGYEIEDEHGRRTVSDVARKNIPGLGDMVTAEWMDAAKLVMDDISGVALVGWQISEARIPLSSH